MQACNGSDEVYGRTGTPGRRMWNGMDDEERQIGNCAARYAIGARRRLYWTGGAVSEANASQHDCDSKKRHRDRKKWRSHAKRIFQQRPFAFS